MTDKENIAPNGKSVSIYVWEYIKAAQKLGLNYKYITPEHEDIEKYAEISDGKKSMRIIKAMLPLNNVIAATIAKKKPATNKLLREANIPVPKQKVITTLEEIDNVISEMTFPLVAKPLDLTNSAGKGVTANINTKEDLILAYKETKSIVAERTQTEPETVKVLIEEMIHGSDHRILVLNGKVIAAIRKVPPTVTGDGKSTILELVEKENQTEKRVSKQISTIKLDNDTDNTLKKQNLTTKSIPDKGQQVLLHAVSNLSRGATTEDVTSVVHKDFIEFSVHAAEVIGLNITGIDFIAEDISKAAKEQSHGIIEVNAHPGSRLHLYPNKGEAVNVPEIVLKEYFNL